MRLRLLGGPAVLVLGLVVVPAVLPRPHAETAHRLPAAGTGESRQVTVFGIWVTPDGGEVDAPLRGVASQLRKLMPDHSFRLIDAANERLGVDRELTCDGGDGRVLSVRLLNQLDAGGKVRLRVRLMAADGDEVLFDRVVATPPDQLVFLDKELEGGRLLVGLGAR